MSAPAVTVPAGELPRLLLVERDPAMCLMLSKALADQGQVITVSDGLEASQAVKLCPPALIIVDLYVPGTDSLALVQAMRAEPPTATLPIILLAASTHKELLLRCLAAGASNFLLKPFNTAELLMCVHVELQLRAAHAQPGG